MEAEEREIAFDEVKDFAECGLCGTAAVISPVGRIVDHGQEICFPAGMETMGPVTQKLYDTLTGIQMGRIEAPKGLDPCGRVIMKKRTACAFAQAVRFLFAGGQQQVNAGDIKRGAFRQRYIFVFLVTESKPSAIRHVVPMTSQIPPSCILLLSTLPTPLSAVKSYTPAGKSAPAVYFPGVSFTSSVISCSLGIRGPGRRRGRLNAMSRPQTVTVRYRQADRRLQLLARNGSGRRCCIPGYPYPGEMASLLLVTVPHH